MKKLPFFLLILLAASCKKDSARITTTSPPDKINAGQNSSTVVHDLHDTVIYRYSLTGDEAAYHIDLNGDGINDFKLSNTDAHPQAGSAIIQQNFITTENSDSYVVCDSIYQTTVYNYPSDSVASQTAVQAPYPKMFNTNDDINITNTWLQGKLLLSAWGGYTPPPVTYFITGYWINTDSKCIAVRYKNVLGWIRIGIYRNANGMKLHEFACVSSQTS